MAKEIQPRTSFITPNGTYCYMRMLFDLRNAGATFVRLVQTVFWCQIRRNVEAYIDRIMVKSPRESDLVADLFEAFDNLQRSNLCLNPKNCTFMVCSRKLLGYLVSQRGIEATPE